MFQTILSTSFVLWNGAKGKSKNSLLLVQRFWHFWHHQSSVPWMLFSQKWHHSFSLLLPCLCQHSRMKMIIFMVLTVVLTMIEHLKWHKLKEGAGGSLFQLIISWLLQEGPKLRLVWDFWQAHHRAIWRAVRNYQGRDWKILVHPSWKRWHRHQGSKLTYSSWQQQFIFSLDVLLDDSEGFL